MHRSHLGDTNDLAKRPFMEMLAPIDRWVVVPMLEGPWEPEEIVAYRNIVGAQLSTEDVLTAATRGEVLSTTGHDGHAYFDPTTGVRRPVETQQNSSKHIRIDELARETSRRPKALTVVYDQSAVRGESAQDALLDKLEQLMSFDVNGLGYLAQAPHLILSCDEVAIQSARQRLLGAGIPDPRIIRWP